MSKAEDKAAKRALEKFPILFSERMGYDKTNLQQERRNAFEKGYHQAKKDIELTWENMFDIFRLVNVVLDDYADGKTKKEVGEKVLKRFKEQRDEDKH